MIIAGAIFLLIPALAAILYLFVLAVAGRMRVGNLSQPAQFTTSRIAVIIPAHNESTGIRSAIQSCLNCDYPERLRQVIVIADNCTDDTAWVAKDAGATCWERNEPLQRGKGLALAWTFDRLASESFDAYLILDADCGLDRHALRLVDASLQQGHQAIQLNHRVTNPDASPISYAATVGRILEYDLGYAPKSALGLSSLLVGTGMVLHRDLLERHPWTAASCAEDTEYTIELARHGIPIYFLANAYIDWSCIESPSQLAVQRRRWAEGNLALGRGQIAALALGGLRRGNLLLMDLAWSLLLQSRPLLLAHAAITILYFSTLAYWSPTPAAQNALITALLLTVLWMLYLAFGIASLGLTTHRTKLLLQSPLVIGNMTLVALRSLWSTPTSEWQRTPREKS